MNKLTTKRDYSDKNNYLSDYYTIGTVEYWKKRLPKLPEEQYIIMEMQSREEYDTEDLVNFKQSLINFKEFQKEKLMREFEEREMSEQFNNPAEDNDLKEFIKKYSKE